MTVPDLIREWNRIAKVATDRNASYPEHVSMRLFFLRKAIKANGLSRQDFESYIAPNP